jgi:carboxymethylenebutenolidase
MGTFESISAGDDTARLYVADGGGGGQRGVVVLHAWWGLNADAQRYADRLAESGFRVVAPDMFGGQVTAEIEEAERLSGAGDEGDAGDIALAAVDELARRLGPDAPIGVVGFSFGAAYAVWATAKREALRAAVVYYGTLSGPSLAKSRAPVLGHFAETDPYETDEGVTQFEQALVEAGREVTIHRYAGTGHWFAEPSRDAYRREQAELAFERTVTFLREQLGTTERS